MKKKKLMLKKITVANLNSNQARKVMGGYTGIVECSIPTPDSGCLEVCGEPGTAGCTPGCSNSCGMATCEFLCTTLNIATCDPCIP